MFKGSGRRRPVDLAPRPSPLAAHRGLALLQPRGGQLNLDEEQFVRWLFERGGLDARSYRLETVRRRLPACLRMLRVSSVVEARLKLQRYPAAIGDAINTMVIGVTSFFRDGGVFDDLAHAVLPALPQARSHAPSPRIWSAGCSDGEEMYSLGILLAEMNMLERSYLLGTDCRPHAIARARAGCYEQRMLRDIRPDWRAKYFEQDQADPAHVRIDADLRAAVQWRTGDVTRLCEPGTWDLILCRNLTMYLCPDIASRVYAALEDALRPGGFLVMGKAERPHGAHRLGAVAPCIYRKDRQ